MKVYFISGLAADSRVFKYIELPKGYEIVFLEWIPPLPQETLQAYALRLASRIDTTEPFALVGLSMGGMIATEIANVFKPTACILLCSVPSSHHMPNYYRWAYSLNLYKLVPVSILKKVSLLKRGFTADSKADQVLIKQVIKESDPSFIKWAIKAILSWENEKIPASLWHIHGSNDSILPVKFTNPTHIVKGGNHLMIMSKAPELNSVLKEIMLSLKQHSIEMQN